MAAEALALQQEDPGTKFLKQVHQLADIPRGATVWEDRGFSWWIGDFRQRLSWEPSDGEPSGEFKVYISTDFLHGLEKSSDRHFAAIAATVPSSSAMVFDSSDDTIKHWTAIDAGDASAEWALPLVIGSAYFQAASVRGIPWDVLERFGGSLHASRPPAGKRTCVHQRVDTWFTEIRLEGKGMSAWAGSEEFAEAAREVSSSSIDISESKDGLTFTMPFGGSNGTGNGAVIQLTTAEPHPIHGYGLTCRLRVPVEVPAGSEGQLCSALNTLEIKEKTGSSLVGSWCIEDSSMVFTSFVPNILYASGLVTAMAHWAAARASWVARKFSKGSDAGAAARLIREAAGSVTIPEQPDAKNGAGFLRKLIVRRS